MQIDFEYDAHQYALDGTEVPSVTQTMEAEGLVSYEYCEDRHKRRGSAVHHIAQVVASTPIKGSTAQEVAANSRWNPDTTAGPLIEYGYAACKYLLESGIQPVKVEARVGSLRLGVAGTLDLYGIRPNGRKALIDFKSGRPLPAVWIQLALYAALLEETDGIVVDEIAPVWLKPNGDYQIWPTQPPGGTNLAVGISAINVYRWRLKNKMLG